MLCLSRKQDEGIELIHQQIGERIHVFVNEIQGNRVQVGIEAGQQWKILRDELLDDQGNEAE